MDKKKAPIPRSRNDGLLARASAMSKKLKGPKKPYTKGGNGGAKYDFSLYDQTNILGTRKTGRKMVGPRPKGLGSRKAKLSK